MNNLRLILLALGAALIAGIYFWGAYQQRELRRRQRQAPELSGPDLPERAAVDAIPILTDGAAAGGGAQAVTGDLHAPLVTLHVASAGSPFAGRAILEAMQAADLRYGTMDIFHRHAAGASPSAPPIFSVADMFEPGSFDLDGMDEVTTGGLSLFMDPRAADDPGAVFEDMLAAAEMLASLLGGEVLGEDRRKLDPVRLAAARARFGR